MSNATFALMHGRVARMHVCPSRLNVALSRFWKLCIGVRVRHVRGTSTHIIYLIYVPVPVYTVLNVPVPVPGLLYLPGILVYLVVIRSIYLYSINSSTSI